jgi:hypothetical protein
VLLFTRFSFFRGPCIVQIYPLTGTLSSFMAKTKLQGLFDGIFVSSRAAQILGEEGFRALSRNKHAVVAVEGAKFLSALNDDTQKALNAKEVELAAAAGLKKIDGKKKWDSVAAAVYYYFPFWLCGCLCLL